MAWLPRYLFNYRYMLTDEGIEAARDSLSRSGFDLANKQPINLVDRNSLNVPSSSDKDCVPTASNTEPMLALNQSKNATKVITIFSSSVSDLLYSCIYSFIITVFFTNSSWKSFINFMFIICRTCRLVRLIFQTLILILILVLILLK